MFGGLCDKPRGSEQGEEQADTGHFERKVSLIFDINRYLKHTILTRECGIQILTESRALY